ncbi:MAG: Gfo/Idh/MocA family oxidoreductase [Paracoccaceae bacterium]
MTGKRIRLGMVGGGQGAFIGAVHRIAARLDDQFSFVAGALSSDPERANQSGLDLGLDPARCYGSFEQMAKAEAARPDGIDVVAIVTPNHMHFPAAKAFLQAGIHVICDKPLTSTIEDARELQALVKASGKLFIVTYNYSAYPMIRHARQKIANGDLGKIRLVQVEYAQDWLTENIESDGQKQASWRTDPVKSGAGGCIGDIGTHAYQLAHFVSGLEVDAVSADLTSFVDGRQLDDNVQVMLRFQGGAKGSLWASQVAPGNENGLRLRIYGEQGGLEWAQEQPNHLWYTPFGESKRLLTRGGAGVPEMPDLVRVPAGHPEGYLEGFANIYTQAAAAIRGDKGACFPDINDGMKGMEFISACVLSANQSSRWIKV